MTSLSRNARVAGLFYLTTPDCAVAPYAERDIAVVKVNPKSLPFL
jgi:hypothetical protein